MVCPPNFTQSDMEKNIRHNDIDFAYPTTRFYNYLLEKKLKKKSTDSQ